MLTNKGPHFNSGLGIKNKETLRRNGTANYPCPYMFTMKTSTRGPPAEMDPVYKSEIRENPKPKTSWVFVLSLVQHGIVQCLVLAWCSVVQHSIVHCVPCPSQSPYSRPPRQGACNRPRVRCDAFWRVLRPSWVFGTA